MIAKRLNFKVLLIGLILTSACANKLADHIDRNPSVTFQVDAPEIRASSHIRYQDESTNQLIVLIDLIEGSFVYKSSGDTLYSEFNIQISIENVDDSKVIESFDKTYRISSLDEDIVNSQGVYSLTETFEIIQLEDKYRTTISVTDLVTGKRTITELESSSSDLTKKDNSLSEIQIFVSGNNTDFTHFNTFNIPSKYDSLKFNFQIFQNSNQDQIELLTRLLKFETDTSIARAAHFPDYHASDIEYLGVDFDDYEVIQQNLRTISGRTIADVEWEVQNLDPGLYRIESYINKGTGDQEYRAKEFAVRSYGFPGVKKPSEYANALKYLLNENKYENIKQLDSEEEIKNAVDRFWLSNINNSVKAKEVINLYYSRVEEANKLFSTFKPGWKTDMGMIYILFGSPWYIKQSLNTVEWWYTYNITEVDKKFTFYKPKSKSKYYPFEHYLLDREQLYFTEQYQKVQQWLTGNLLRLY